MWKFIKLIGFLLKGLFWLLLLLFLAGLVLLYILERDIPAPFVRRLAAAASTDDLHVRIERATYSLKSGLRLYRIKALPKRVADSAWVSADEVAIAIALQPNLPLGERLRGITVKNIVMPSLPPKAVDAQKKSDPVHPIMLPFPLVVEKADILGIQAERLSATVTLADARISATDIDIRWPDKAFPMQVKGYAELDLTARRAAGKVKGQAFPDNLLPLFTFLHARGAIRQINCFSKLTRPIQAEYSFDVDIDNSDFSMLLDLDVGPCDYRGVPLAFAKGTLGIYGTNIYTTVAVGPIKAESTAGAPLSGSLVYREETEGLELDVATRMELTPLITIINVLNHGELDRIQSFGPLSVSATGVVALSSTESTLPNNLTGKVSFSEGSILNLLVKDMTGDFSLTGYTARFDNVTGTSMSGGKIAGDITFFFPDYAATATVFRTDIQVANVALEEISHAFNVTNARAGLVSGTIRLDGPTHKHTIHALCGEGHVKVRDGVINRMKLFAGFTDYLTRTIPGVSSLVNQSSGSMDFTITNGVLKTENLVIEGDLFSIKGRGTYNLATDKLDFVAQANIFKQKTIAGKITHLVTLPFTRLLLEFRVFGSLEHPDWSYVNILEKITDGFSDMTSQTNPPHPSP